MNRDGAAVAATDTTEQSRTIYHARRFEYAAAPTTPIEGVIRDKDTGRPIAGIVLRGMVFKEHNLVPVPNVEATTDAQGRYRLDGLPKGPAYRLFLEPAAGLPYIKATFRVAGGSPGLDPLKFDIALKRGVLVRGRVTDKATGAPARGHIAAYSFADNPHVDEFPGYRESRGTDARVEDDGRYEVVTLPGRGLIACQSNQGLYRGGIGAEAIKGYDPRTGFINTLPHLCDANVYHAIAELAVDPRSESSTMDIRLDPGRTLSMTIVDPEGKPVGHTMVSGLTDLFSNAEYEQESPTIEVHALDPFEAAPGHDQPRRAEARRIDLPQGGRERSVDGATPALGDDHRPRRRRRWPAPRWPEAEQPHSHRRAASHRPGTLAAEYIGPRYRARPRRPLPHRGPRPGPQVWGECRGWFRGRGAIFQDVTVAPGEVEDLGDLNVAPPRQNGQE